MNEWIAHYQSPLGVMELRGRAGQVTSLRFIEEEAVSKDSYSTASDALITMCFQQLDEYFRGERREFTIPLALTGTPFQLGVWAAIRTIPPGETITYKALAASIGKKKAIRAAGSATGKNPFAILIPCHRVIGSDESLHGYAWGVWRKEWLLKHEQAMR